MNSNFWDNIKKLLNSRNKPDIWLIKEAKLGKTAIINGQNRNTVPSADKAYRIACALEVTVEELLDGEDGVEYVRQLFADKGLLWEPPRRIADIVEVLNAVDDITLDTVRTMVLPLKEKKGDAMPDLAAG